MTKPKAMGDPFWLTFWAMRAPQASVVMHATVSWSRNQSGMDSPASVRVRQMDHAMATDIHAAAVMRRGMFMRRGDRGTRHSVGPTFPRVVPGFKRERPLENWEVRGNTRFHGRRCSVNIFGRRHVHRHSYRNCHPLPQRPDR
jgi:hypothetical protein